MSKLRVFRTLKSKSLYWTLFCPKYWAPAGAGTIRARVSAATATAAGRRDEEVMGAGSLRSLKHQSPGRGGKQTSIAGTLHSGMDAIERAEGWTRSADGTALFWRSWRAPSP